MDGGPPPMMNNVINNTTIVYQQNSQPVMVFPGIMWTPLGKTCEINNCQQEAYKHCDHEFSSCGTTYFKGCGKPCASLTLK